MSVLVLFLAFDFNMDYLISSIRYNDKNHETIYMLLTYIIAAALLSGALSCLLFAAMPLARIQKNLSMMVSLSIGFILGLCFLHGLPEVVEGGNLDTHRIFLVFLSGILITFLLEKFKVFRHNHHHEGDGHHHEAGYNQKLAGKDGRSILLGSGLHYFADGMIMAGAFLHAPHIGFITALAIAIHEVPMAFGDFIVLIHTGMQKKRAILYVLGNSVACVLGAVLTYVWLGQNWVYLPYVLVLGYSVLTYVAISDLLPQIQTHHHRTEWMLQLSYVAVGLGVMAVVSEYMHH